MSMRMPPVRADVGEGDGRLVHVDAIDVVMAHGSPAYLLITGFVAGLLIWLPPLVIVYLNRLLMIAGSSSAPNLTPNPTGILDFERMWPYWLATGVAGAVLAWLRRISARIGWYKEIASFRLGLNGVVASIGGAIVCLWLIFAGSDAGFLLAILSFGVIIGGFLVNAVWEWIHNVFLRPYGRRAESELLERAVRHALERYAHLKPKRLDSVKVKNGKVTLKGVWEDGSTRREVENELRGISGVSIVEFERPDDA